LSAAVERFIAEKNAGSFKALIPMIDKFSSGYEEAYGIKPGMRAGELCQDKLQRTDYVSREVPSLPPKAHISIEAGSSAVSSRREALRTRDR
jgi:hypothetical protein